MTFIQRLLPALLLAVACSQQDSSSSGSGDNTRQKVSDDLFDAATFGTPVSRGKIIKPGDGAQDPTAPLDSRLAVDHVLPGACVGIFLCYIHGDKIDPTQFSLSTTAPTGHFYSDASCKKTTTTAKTDVSKDDGPCATPQVYYSNSAAVVNDTLLLHNAEDKNTFDILFTLVNGFPDQAADTAPVAPGSDDGDSSKAVKSVAAH